MNEKRSHTLNTLGVPPSTQTGGQWAGGAEIKEGDNRGEGVADADRAEKKGEKGRKERKRPKTLATQGRRNARALRGLCSVIAH